MPWAGDLGKVGLTPTVLFTGCETGANSLTSRARFIPCVMRDLD